MELIGGSDGPARALVQAAIAAGKPVVTANKALLAVHGAALAAAAEERGVPLAFEAAVAGGIPVIKALREGLAANRILRIAGILNGTCNYILTQMRERGREFAEVLADAQKLGYAEADPSFDIDGIDAAHKLAILAALAFGRPVAFDAVHVEGIRKVSALDIAFASELGYRIKLLGIARHDRGGHRGARASVHGAAVRADRPGGWRVQRRGGGGRFRRPRDAGRPRRRRRTDRVRRGRRPDRHRAQPHHAGVGRASAELSNAPSVPMSAHVGAYYLRLMVVDRPGVIADVTAVLRDLGVSLESMLQRGRSPGEAVPVVLVTHETQESAMREALARIAALDAVLEAPTMIRIEAGVADPAEMASLQLDDAAAQTLGDRLGTTGGVQLGEQRLQVELHGVHRNAERARHRLVAHALTDQGQDLGLARGQRWRGFVTGRAEAVAAEAARRAHQQAGGNRAQRRVELRAR